MNHVKCQGLTPYTAILLEPGHFSCCLTPIQGDVAEQGSMALFRGAGPA